MFSYLEETAISYATAMPLPLFATVLSFLEEIIAPIPSGPVMLVVGSLSQVQGYAVPGLVVLVLCAVLGKVAGALVVYTVADKAEDVIATRFVRFIGVSHAQIEAFGARFKGDWKDYVILTTLRTLPFVPSVVLSAGSGVLKIRLRVFIVATFFGSILRDAFFIYLGYASVPAAENLIDRLGTIESLLQVLVATALLLALSYSVFRYRKRIARKKGL